MVRGDRETCPTPSRMDHAADARVLVCAPFASRHAYTRFQAGRPGIHLTEVDAAVSLHLVLPPMSIDALNAPGAGNTMTRLLIDSVLAGYHSGSVYHDPSLFNKLPGRWGDHDHGGVQGRQCMPMPLTCLRRLFARRKVVSPVGIGHQDPPELAHVFLGHLQPAQKPRGLQTVRASTDYLFAI